MARPSKLSSAQTERIRALHHKVPAPKLAKRYHISESTLYKVFDGSYVARPDAPKRKTLTIQEKLRKTVSGINLEDFDELTLSAVQFVLAKVQLEKNLEHKQSIH